MMELSTDFDVLDRPIETDGRRFIKFSPFQCQEHFNNVKKKVEDLFTIAESLAFKNSEAQYHMILRAQFVFMIGAFDFYMHELTKYALDQMNRSVWICSQDFLKIEIPMGTVQEFMELSNEEYFNSFLKFITRKYSTVTMVNGEIVHEQLKMLGLENESIYKRCYGANLKPKSMFIDTLSELFEKRNKIAHQVDQSHIDASEYSITREDVEHCIQQLSCIVDSITMEVNDKNHQQDTSKEFFVLNYSDISFGTKLGQFKQDYKRLICELPDGPEVIIPYLGELTEKDITAIRNIPETARKKILVITDFSKSKPLVFSISSIEYSEEENNYLQIESELMPRRYSAKSIKLVIKGELIDTLEFKINAL